MMGVLFKFFEVIGNLGNLKLLNVVYGEIITIIFELIDKISLTPELKPDSII